MVILLVVLVGVLSAVSPVRADDKPISPQAQRMKDCNVQAHDRALAGDARKQFMSDCLRGGSADRTERSSQGAASPSQAAGQGESRPGTR
jgi:hypothetical protein